MERVDFILELSEIEAINGIMLLAKAFSLSFAFFISICILYDVCKTITPYSQETLWDNEMIFKVCIGVNRERTL